MTSRTAARSLAVALALASVPSLAMASVWDIDPVHSAATFSVRHLMVSNVRGEFSKVTGVINLDDKDVAKSTVEASIDATTVNTREPKRDEDLKSEKYLDVAKFPTLTFKSTKVARAGKNKLKVSGELTIHGVTKPVVLEVEENGTSKDPFYGVTKAGFQGTTKINRKDFGLTWNKTLETGGVLVGDEVAIVLDIEAIKKADAPAAAATPAK